MQRAFIDEIFSSIQGEGILVGQRHLFVRFHGCSLRCHYCDTITSVGAPGFCTVEKTPGKKDMYLVPNPFTSKKLTRILLRLKRASKTLHSALAITGGEPLEQTDFLLEWLPQVKKYFTIFLETNGIHPAHLKRLIRYIDTIGMDIKLPSSTAQREFWEEHESFLRIAHKKRVFIKIVVTADTDKFELLKAGALISKVDRKIPTILQPVTPFQSVRQSPTSAQLMDSQESLTGLLDEVRVIPQVHKLCFFP